MPGAPVEPIERALAWRRLSAALFGDMPPPAPPALGEFQVLAVLGRGAMGTVYLARDAALERDVALKVLHRGVGDAEARGRLLAEARALARVSHPALVAVHAIGEHLGRVYIVMERVPGVTLRSWQALGSRSWREILEVYLQFGRGVQALHQAGLVHRDLKPENVLVDDDGRARIVDLGLSRHVDARAAEIAGTPLYMAPEQFAGAAGPLADLFAFCVALFEALYRVRPFVGETPAELCAAIVAGALVTPATAEVPERIRAVLVRGLRADPARRWPSMRALLDALAAAAATTRGQRDRQVLLARLETAWIEGVLERSLAGGVRVRPTLRERSTCPSGHDPKDFLARTDHAASFALVGGAGAGKTTALLELASDALHRARRDPTRPLPVILQLASWSGGSLAEWVVDEVRDELGIPRHITRGWLDDDGLVLFLDGLDRVAAARRAACVRAIGAFRAAHLASLVVTCRDDIHAGLDPPLALDTVFDVPRLEPDRVRVALEREGAPLTGLLEALEAHPALRELLRTPLLVDIAARTFRGCPAPSLAAAGSAGSIRRELWSAYVARALSGLHVDAAAQLRERLAFIAGQLECEDRGALWIERLQPTWLRGRLARNLHAALTLSIIGSAIAVLVGGLVGLASTPDIGLQSALLVAPTLALFLGLVHGVREIRPVERLTWSTACLRQGLAGAARRGLVLGLVLASIAATIWGAGEATDFIAAVFVTNLVVYAFLFAIALAALAALRGEALSRRIAPNQAIRSSARNATVVAAVVGLAVMVPLLAVTFVFGPPPAPPLQADEAREAIRLWRGDPASFFALIELCVGATIGLFAGMHRGGLAVVQHGVLRILLAATRRLPLRLVAMLDGAAERALLRKIGGGYIFIHDELREQLAASTPRPQRG
ncbi:protein kinase [Nannocystis sp. SCPEA4]|uniref:protein kinase domain-containing protein n=1 Tax=Nannocystis sp. SCPEA4 TaxID=2996787 RepID=UPI00226E0273|nr:protein kinase [Nannocystis sp. SCPEA4]MCY1059180.1 protein kinase [Nannocystis sp. SCPEA4]